jgi:Rieske Fe-S protein
MVEAVNTTAATGKNRTNPFPNIGAHIMNTKIIAAFVLATVMAAPAFADDLNYPAASVAATGQASGVTRAQVRAQLAQIEKAGYNPAADNTQYPNDIEAAEARVAKQENVASNNGGSVHISSTFGALASARPTANDGTASIYFGS